MIKIEFEDIKSKIDFKRLENLRVKNKKIIDYRNSVIIVFSVSCSIVFLYLCSSYLSFKILMYGTIIIFSTFTIALNVSFVSKHQERVEKSYRDNVLFLILSSLGIDLKLRLGKDSRKNFVEGKLFLVYEGFRCEDFFEGTLDEIPYSFSEVKLIGKKGRKIFRGVYAKFSYELRDDIIIDVVKDGTFDIHLFEKFNIYRKKLVKIENESFENQYTVYCNDREFTQELLSNSLIDNLLKLNETLNTTVYFTIRKGSVHIAFEDNYNYFDIDLNKKIERLAEIHIIEITEIYKKMNEIKSFIDENIVPSI
jgi:hypothetical protein